MTLTLEKRIENLAAASVKFHHEIYRVSDYGQKCGSQDNEDNENGGGREGDSLLLVPAHLR